MRPDQDRHDAHPAEAAPKKPYDKPRMDDYGSMVELTGSGTGTGNDGSGDPFASSGAVG